jgi:hypothetical protein
MAPQSVQLFVAAMCAGAALLALWIVATKPQLGPRDLVRALLHVILSIVVGAGITPGIRAIAALGVPGAQFAGTFGIALPALTYMFLAAAWLMRVMRDYFQTRY